MLSNTDLLTCSAMGDQNDPYTNSNDIGSMQTQFTASDTSAPRSPESATLSFPPQSADNKTSIKVEVDGQDPGLVGLTPEAKEVARLKRSLQGLQDRHSEIQSMVSESNDVIEEVRRSYKDAERASTMKRSELKELEAQKKILTRKIKEVKQDRERLLSDENAWESSLNSELSQLQQHEENLSRHSAAVKTAEQEYEFAQQQLQLKTEFIDDGLREVAGQLRGLSTCALMHEDKKPAGEDEIDWGSLSPPHDTNLMKWERLSTENATVADFADVSGMFDAIDRKIKCESVEPKVKEETKSEENCAEFLNKGTSGEMIPQSTWKLEDPESPLEMTSEAFRQSLEQANYHAARVQRYLAALSGEQRKRKAFELEQDDHSIDHDNSSGDDEQDGSGNFKRRLMPASAENLLG